MTVYGLAASLAGDLPGSLVTSVARHRAGCVLILDGPGPRVIEVLYNRRQAEILMPGDTLAGPGSLTADLEAAAGARVVSVSQPGLERVILIGLEVRDRWGNPEDAVLRLDLSPGMKAVSLFIGPEGRLAGSCGGSGTRAPSSSGELPAPRRWSLLDMPDECPPAFEPALAEAGAPGGGNGIRETAGALVMTVGGVDPALARALCARAAEKNGDFADVLWADLVLAGRLLKDEGRGWAIYDFPGTGQGGFCNIYPSGMPFGTRPQRPRDLYEALSLRAGEIVIPALKEDLARAVRKSARRELRRAGKLLERLEADLAGAEAFKETRHLGQLLSSNRHLMRRGMRSISVRDFSGDGQVEIELDPALTPDENIRLYFKRAKKGEKGLVMIRERRARARQALASARERMAAIEKIDSPAELFAMLPAPGSRQAAAKGDGKDRRKFRSFRLDSQHVILVGRSDEENDQLTHRHASPADLWFHAQGMPGSHVLLRGAGPNTPRAYIEKAAMAAAWFSKGRTSSTVPVIFTEKRYVRKPRGARPGTAACTREKTLFVAPALPDDNGEEE